MEDELKLPKYVVVERATERGTWSVEGWDSDGGCLLTVFYGPDSNLRACRYAEIVNRHGRPNIAAIVEEELENWGSKTDEEFAQSVEKKIHMTGLTRAMPAATPAGE